MRFPYFAKVYITMLTCILFVGCVTRNPSTAPVSVNGSPATNPPPAFIVDPRLALYGSKASDMIAASAPVNPYAGMMRDGLAGVLGIATILSGAWAQRKSGEALQAKATAGTLATGVVKAGPEAVATVIEHASNTANFAEVSQLLKAPKV